MGQALGFRRLPRGPPRVSAKGESVLGVDVQGVTENIAAIDNMQIDTGRGITYEEVRRPQQKQKEGEPQGSPSDPHVGGEA